MLFSSSAPVAILGSGILGGSLALALREKQPGRRTMLWVRREEAAGHLRGMGFHASTDLGETVASAGLLVLCVPVGSMPSLFEESINAGLPKGALVTDVGSVKKPVVEALTPMAATAGHVFVGSHPMAGSEKNGMEAASATLFHGASCALTPVDDTPAEALQAVGEFWESLGCRIRIMGPDDHDKVVAAISHLPHFLSAVLVQAALEGTPDSGSLAGGGFRDMSRIAAGPPAMWEEIFHENKSALLKALDEWGTRFSRLRQGLEENRRTDVLDFLAKSKHLRDLAYPPLA